MSTVLLPSVVASRTCQVKLSQVVGLTDSCNYLPASVPARPPSLPACRPASASFLPLTIVAVTDWQLSTLLLLNICLPAGRPPPPSCPSQLLQ